MFQSQWQHTFSVFVLHSTQESRASRLVELGPKFNVKNNVCRGRWLISDLIPKKIRRVWNSDNFQNFWAFKTEPKNCGKKYWTLQNMEKSSRKSKFSDFLGIKSEIYRWYRDRTYSWIVKNDWSFELAKSNIIVHDWSVGLETWMDTTDGCSDSLWTIWQTIIWSHDNQSNEWFWLSMFKCIIITENMVTRMKNWPVYLRFGSRDDTMSSGQNHFTIDDDTSTVWTVWCDKETLPWIFTISSDFGSTKDTSRDWIFIWFINWYHDTDKNSSFQIQLS